MKLNLSFITILILTSSQIWAQQPALTLKSQDHQEITDCYGLANGGIYILYKGDGETTPKTTYTVYDTNFKLTTTYTSDQRYKDKDLLFQSPSGKQFLCKQGKGLKRAELWHTEGEDQVFNDKDFNGEINEDNMMPSLIGKDKYDVTPITFLTDTHFISLGRKQGKEHYKKGKYKDMEIFMYKKPLNGEEPSYIPIKTPERNFFTHTSPLTYFANNDFFILVFKWLRKDRKHVYRPVYYDYDGNILKEFKITLEIPEDKGDFGILNLGASSFQSYTRLNSDGSTRNSFNYQRPTQAARAKMVYDEFTDSFYIYGSVKNKKADDGLLITRYNNEGQQLWQKYQKVPESSFHGMNSYNRNLRIVATHKFVGLRLYSHLGKAYNHFYLFDIESGEPIISKIFSNKEYKNSGFFNTSSAMMGVYDATFASFIKDFEVTENEHEAHMGYFVDNGFLAVFNSKNEKDYTFYKFDFK